MSTVLVFLPEGFEEIEALAPIDLWRRAGLTVTTAALQPPLQVKGRNGITVLADTTLDVVAADAFDVLVLPGGPGVRHLREDERVLARVRQQAAEDRWLAAICAAPTVLQAAGVLAGRRYTAHFSVADELPELLSTERVVIDGHFITSRGAGTALDFGFALIEQVLSPEKSREVAASICA